ncbi:hypothetical protein GE061_017780 [Apolygus lucorum]|uniref:Uncharacterized protein n=1 Tax=Apolygus lucorum TaxID=248454 RepID=A0A8S9XEN4_APOLU|nr:hypothetical protein GE061_017780 [Apolygus lucorum]
MRWSCGRLFPGVIRQEDVYPAAYGLRPLVRLAALRSTGDFPLRHPRLLETAEDLRLPELTCASANWPRASHLQLPHSEHQPPSAMSRPVSRVKEDSSGISPGSLKEDKDDERAARGNSSFVEVDCHLSASMRLNESLGSLS